MNDMDLLRQWRDAQVSSSATPPATVRVRALTGRPAPACSRRAGTPRLAWSLGLSAGLAVAVVGGVLWAQGAPGSGTAAGSPSGQPPATGAQVLREAALALPKDAVTPRRDQFLYTLSYQVYGVHGGPDKHQVWQSIDGSRDGVITAGPSTGTGPTETFPAPACHDGRMPLVGPDHKVIPGRYESMTCHPVPAFLSDLPTDPAAMLTWLSNWRALGVGPANQATAADQPIVAFNNAAELLSDYYLTAPMESAVFNALAQLPGITVYEDVKDPAGRHGIGVGVSASPSVAGPTAPPEPQYKYLIFDQDSHAFLGTSISAVLRQALVDDAGQLPS